MRNKYYILYIQISFDLETRGTNNVVMYIHEADEAFLSEDLFGTTYAQLPKVKENDTEKELTIQIFKVRTY